MWILCTNLIISNVQFTVSQIWLWCFYNYGGASKPKDCPPVCRDVHSIEAKTQPASWKKTANEKHAHCHISWGILRGERLSYLSIINFALCSFPIIFSKIFSLATLDDCILSSTCKHAMCFRRVKYGLKILNRLGKMSENFRGEGFFDSHCTCLSNLIFLPLIFPNFYENMHAIRSPFFQDTGSVHASMEWTPLQTGGGVLGMDAPP